MPQPRKIVVTGATSGVGAAIAVDQARRGASVVATGRSDNRLRALTEQAAAIGVTDSLKTLSADLTKPDDLDALVELASASGEGAIDALVLAAFGHIGEDQGTSVVDLTDEDLTTFLNDSLVLNFKVARAFIPMLKASNGRLVGVVADWGFPQHNVLTSGGTDDEAIGSEVFVAAKYAMTGFLASVERMSGVTACGLYPGVIASAAGEAANGESAYLSLDATDAELEEAGYSVPDGAIPLSDIALAVDFVLSTRATARSVLLKPARHDYDGL